MTRSRTYLAVDLGASSGRVIAGHYDGSRLALDEVHRFPNGPKEIGGSYRWPFETLFAEVKAGLRRAAHQFGDDIVSVGVDTWGVDYGLLDGEGHLVDTPFAYRDPRTNGMEEEACRRVPRRDIYNVTGIQFMFFNTLYQLLSEVVGKRPELDRAKRLLFTPDLFNYWLTGKQVNEYSIASTSQLLDAQSRGWALDLIKGMQIPVRLFGEIVEPGTSLGGLLPEVAEETGLRGVNVIAVGSHDTASAVAAVPTLDKNYAYLSSGTWSLMGIETPAPVINDKTYKYGFTNEGGVEGTIRLLKNITGLWLVQECQRVWAESGEDLGFAELARQAEAAEPFTAFIDPDDPSFVNPCDMPSHIRAYCERSGQPAPQGVGQVVRTALDSLAFRCRTVFEMLEDLAGRRLDVLHIVGGGVQNQLLNQLTANAVNRKVMAGPIEATAAGNVLVQMIASGAIGSLAEGRSLIQQSFKPEEYSPAESERYEEAYRRYGEVTKA